MPFACSICEQESTRICVFCTKDACNIHICGRCGCCSDCCPCEVPLNEPIRAPVADAMPAMPASEPDLAGFAPPDVPPSSGLDADLPEPGAEFDVPGTEPAQPDPWTSSESQPSTPEEPADEPSETPKV